jgi:hypothetical protein
LYGKFYTGSRPYLHEVRFGRIVLDVWFGAVDDLQGDSIFSSLEPTGWWWNELEYTTRESFFSGHGRVGRMPPVIEGGSKWSGSIADLNAPPENHWLPMMTGEVELPDDMPLDERMAYERPREMAYFVQPPAVLPEKDAGGRISGFRVNAEAENLKWLAHREDEAIKGERYYKRAMIGKPSRWIRKNLGNEILPMVEGEPVWTNFDDQFHTSKEHLVPVEGLDLWIGLDFGRRPFAVFAQRVNGQWRIQFEAGMENAGASKFAPEVRRVIAQFYPWVQAGRAGLHIYGDPKGQDGTQSDERTAYDVFAAHSLKVEPAPVKQNNIKTRLDTVEYALDRSANGRAHLLIGPKCRRLRMAMLGGYRYPKERPSPVDERKPIKDRFSDAADALGYLLIGGGESRQMVEPPGGRTAQIIRLARQGGQRRFAGARRPF